LRPEVSTFVVGALPLARRPVHMHEVRSHFLPQRVEFERRSAKQDAEGVVPVKLTRSKDECTVQCQVDVSEMPRLKRRDRVVFAYRDDKEELQWEYTSAGVAEVAGGTVCLAEGWPTQDWWPKDRFMALWVNEVEYQGLHANIHAMFESPSWLRSVLCESLSPEEVGNHCAAEWSPDSSTVDLQGMCKLAAVQWHCCCCRCCWRPIGRFMLFRSRRTRCVHHPLGCALSSTKLRN